MHFPFILAFEPTFVEVRHAETGALMQIVSGFDFALSHLTHRRGFVRYPVLA